jgi:RNA recognition motif-containing protein
VRKLCAARAHREDHSRKTITATRSWMGMREGNSVMTDTEQRKPFTLYVGNIHQCTTRNDLSKFFEDAGFKCDFVYTIKNVPGSNEKLNRPSAFVVLENPEQSASGDQQT